jgi:hypothetical protein
MNYKEYKNNNNSTHNFYDIDKKLNDLLRENVIHKYTKSEKRTYQELQNYTIKLEIENNELERKIENLKKEIFISNQAAIDLGLELEESRMIINSLTNELKMKEKTLKMAHSRMETEAIDKFVTDNYENCETKKNNKSHIDSKRKDTSEMLELSLSNSSLNEVSIDYGLIHTMKKKKKNEQTLESNYHKLEEENTNLIDDLNLLVEEVKNLRSNIDEKDKIISILYQEVENLKNSDNDEELKIKQNLTSEAIAEISRQHLENLESIKSSLVEFLNYYGIKEDFNNFNNFSSNLNKDSTDYMIDIRMKEIKYILVNLKKINIIFKTLFMEYSKNLINLFENEYMVNVNSKFEQMQDKVNCLTNYMERITNFKE